MKRTEPITACLATFNYLTLDLDVKFEFTPGEKEVWTYSNGDPGHPGYPDTYEISEIWWQTKDRKGNPVEVDIYDLINQDDLVYLEELLEEKREYIKNEY